jgi:hypothetical protein
VCYDASPAVIDTFKDVSQCSDAGSGSDSWGVLTFTEERRKYLQALVTRIGVGAGSAHGSTSTSTLVQSPNKRSASRASCSQSIVDIDHVVNVDGFGCSWWCLGHLRADRVGWQACRYAC